MSDRPPVSSAAISRDEHWEAITAMRAAKRDRSDAASLRHAAEMAVQATLPLLPLHGSWNDGYQVDERIDPTLSALPEEWAEAAHAIAELHAALEAGR